MNKIEASVNKKSKKMNVIVLILISLLLVLLIFIKKQDMYLSDMQKSSKYTLAALDTPIEYNNKDQYVFAAKDGDTIIATKDGIKRINEKGIIIYDQPYSFNNPSILNKGQYTVAVDIGGNSVYVFNDKTLFYNKVVNYPIISYDINDEGMLMIVEENKDAHIISVYNNEGTVIFKRNTTIDNGGYPVDLAISSKGDKLVVSYLDIMGLEPIAKLVFFDLDDNGLYVIDEIIGSIHQENTLISDVMFIDESNCIAISGNSIKGFSFGSSVKEVFSIPLTNKIIDVDYEEDSDFFTIAYGDALPGNDNSLDGQVVSYDKYGNAISSFNTKERIDYLKVSNGQIIIGENKNFVSMTLQGEINWTYTSTVDVVTLCPLDESRILLVGSNYYQILKKVRV